MHNVRKFDSATILNVNFLYTQYIVETNYSRENIALHIQGFSFYLSSKRDVKDTKKQLLILHREISWKYKTAYLEMKARVTEGQECSHRLRFRGKRDASKGATCGLRVSRDVGGLRTTSAYELRQS